MMEEPEDISQYMPNEIEKRLLLSLVHTSDLGDEEKEEFRAMIRYCYDYKVFEQIQYKLEHRQQSIHQIQNPSQKEICRHLRKVQ